MKTIVVGAEAEPEDPTADLERVAELAREVERERLGALLELLADVGARVEPLETEARMRSTIVGRSSIRSRTAPTNETTSR